MIKLDENAFKPGMLAALQPLHHSLKNRDIDFVDGKRALVNIIRTYAIVPKIGDELVVQVDRHSKDEAALLRSIETILLIMGGTGQEQPHALSAVAETSDEDPEMDKDMQELKAGSKYMGICPICKKPLMGRITKKDPATGKETVEKEADKIEYWHGKKAHVECVAAEKEKEGKKEPEPAAVAETMNYESMDAAIQKLIEDDKEDEPEDIGEEVSQKHFVKIAEIIKTARDKDEIAAGIADFFAAENPRFNRSRFLQAAGISVEEGDKTEEEIPEGFYDFKKAYIEAALWSSNDDDEEPLNKNYDAKDIDPETLEKMSADCKKFYLENGEDIGPDGKDAGHDFWLTRNRHGAGFWDGDWDTKEDKTIGKRLTDAAHKFGEFNLYVGDDGKVYGS